MTATAGTDSIHSSASFSWTSEAIAAPPNTPLRLRRAATWCESNGLADQAIEYLLRAGDVDRLVPLLAQIAQPAFDDGRAATVERWFRDADSRVIERYPPLAVLQGWLAAVAGRPIQVEQIAERVRTLTFEGPTDDGWASFAAAVSIPCVRVR